MRWRSNPYKSPGDAASGLLPHLLEEGKIGRVGKADLIDTTYEGDLLDAIGRSPKRPYPIEYGALTPRKADCDNLLAPFALSATHVAFGSIRMEATFMTLSHAAGTAAALAIEANTTIQGVDYGLLRKKLISAGAVLDWN